MYYPGQHTLISGDTGSGRTNVTLLHMQKFAEHGHRLVSIGLMLEAPRSQFPQLERREAKDLADVIQAASPDNPTLIIIEHDMTSIPDMSVLQKVLVAPYAPHLTLLVETTRPNELAACIDLFSVRISMHCQDFFGDLVLGSDGPSITIPFRAPGLGLVREDKVIHAMQFPLFREEPREDSSVGGIPQPGHTLIVGPSGSGKSTALLAVIAGAPAWATSRIVVLADDETERWLPAPVEYLEEDGLTGLMEQASSDRPTMLAVNGWPRTKEGTVALHRIIRTGREQGVRVVISMNSGRPVTHLLEFFGTRVWLGGWGDAGTVRAAGEVLGTEAIPLDEVLRYGRSMGTGVTGFAREGDIVRFVEFSEGAEAQFDSHEFIDIEGIVNQMV